MRTMRGAFALRAAFSEGAKAVCLTLGLTILAGQAAAESTEPSKQELPAKTAPIEKYEPRARVLEGAPQPEVITGAIGKTVQPQREIEAAEPPVETTPPQESAAPAAPSRESVAPAAPPTGTKAATPVAPATEADAGVTAAAGPKPAYVPPPSPPATAPVTASRPQPAYEPPPPPPSPATTGSIYKPAAPSHVYTPPPSSAEMWLEAGPRTAVDGTSFRAAALGGSVDGQSVWGGTASVATPLGPRYGLQIDGLAVALDSRFASDDAVLGAAAHLFRRDPATGLVGLYAHYAHADAFSGIEVYAIGAEAARYFGRWTLEGVAGIEGGSTASGIFGGVPITLDVDTRFFDTVALSYYLGDDLRLSIGQSLLGGEHALDLGAEWSFAPGAASIGTLFAQGSFLEDGDTSVLGGLRLYFGQRDKSLIARHREDILTDGPLASRPLSGAARALSEAP